MKIRVLILFSLLLLGWGFLWLRAAQIQIFPNARLERLKNKQFESSVRIRSRRGAIVDRKGRELAASIPSYSIFADPLMVKNPRDTARKLSKILGIPTQTIQKRLTKKKSRFVWLGRQFYEDVKLKVQKLKNPGLGIVEEPKRIYPNGTLLGQTLGFVGRDGHGLEGLEKQFNKSLKGELRHIIVPRDARGRPLLASASTLTAVPDGSDLELTVDADIQFELEKQLRHVVEQYDAEGASGIVLDVHTSDILAIGMTPSVDLNRPFSSSTEERRNRVISDAFEPGSTLKTFVIAAAFKEGLAQPNSRYYCEKGRMTIGRRVISEADSHHAFEWLTTTEILAYSSNIGTTKIAFELGPQKLYHHLQDFGFGHRTGVSFAGEASGILHQMPWNQHLLANISFGHGIAVTPLQMASAYTAVANGGVLRTPRIVKSIRSKEKNIHEDIEPDKGRRILTEEMASNLRMMLTAATGAQGTGKRARIPGFLVGGKTGTAQMVDFKNGGYKKGAYVSSFAGFAPAHDPRFVIYIAVDAPKKAYYGSEVAAPVFAKVAQFAIRQIGLPPVLLSQSDVVNKKGRLSLNESQARAIHRVLATSPTSFPDLNGLALREAIKRIGPTKASIKIQGSGFVKRTIPEAGTDFGDGKPITLILSEDLQ